MTTIDQMFQGMPLHESDAPPKGVERDRWGRPKIIVPDQSGTTPYTRASTLAKALDDTKAIADWKARMTGRGVAMRPDLLALFASLNDMEDREQKKAANEAAEAAQEAAGSTTKRTIGTAFHTFTEHYDKTGQFPPHVPEGILRTLLVNYAEKTRHIRWLAWEQFVVVDEIGVAGTADRVGVVQGQKPRIHDIKSGRVDYGQLAFAMQLAIYAHGRLYRAQDGARSGWPAMDLEVGHIIHADQKTGEVTLYDVDLVAGWKAVKLATDVRAARKAKGLMQPTKLPAPPAAEAAPEKTIMQHLSACRTLDDLRAVYEATGSQWEKKHREFADIMANDIRAGKTQ